MFVLKLDGNGDFVWARSFVGTPGQNGNGGLGIAVDAGGNVCTTGYFSGSMDFDPAAGSAFTLSSLGSSNIFISKLDASGKFVWAKGLVGDGGYGEQGTDLAVDASGNVCVTGFF